MLTNLFSGSRMNIIGDGLFDIHLKGKELINNNTYSLKKRVSTHNKRIKNNIFYKKFNLSVKDLKSSLLQKNITQNKGWKCYCTHDEMSTFVPTENKSVTECLVSSLNVSNAENILSLTENYITENYLTFSSTTIKSFILFLTDTTNRQTYKEAHKYRIKTVLDDQLRFHPSCSPYMSTTYQILVLSKDVLFSDLTIMEYVLAKIEIAICDKNINCFLTDKRVSRRYRQPVAYETITKKSKTVVYEDNTEDRKVVNLSKNTAQMDLSYLIAAFDFLTEILKHDLGVILKRGDDVRSSIIVKLFFKCYELVEFKGSVLEKIFQIYKNCESPEIYNSISELVELIAHTCVFLDDNEKYNPLDIGRSCSLLVSEFNVSVFGQKPTDEAFIIITGLKPEWLRYHAAHYVLENIMKQKIDLGFTGITHILNSILMKINQKRKLAASKEVLKNLNNNQLKCEKSKVYPFY